ncbi:hypothetical protein os1_34440 [Comamonadaceae bacterium OS-1]|nr:hypothetical protein os1_34440 [Comamonadaceae bacterium OS-1]
MSFDALKVSTRLAMGFGIATLLGLLMAVVSTVQMKSLASDLNAVANDRMVKVDQLATLQDNLNGIARATRNIMVRQDPVFREGERRKITDLRAENSKLLDALDTTITLPKGRELLKTIVDTRTPYNQGLDAVIALTLQNKLSEASDLLLGHVSSLQVVLFKAVDDASNMQHEAGRELAKNAGDSANFYANLLTGLAAATAVVAGLLGWAITRSLTRALGAEPGQVNIAVQRVADSDLAMPIGLRDNDNTSTMAAVKRMQESLSRTVGSVRSNAEGVASASAQIAQGNHDLSARTEQQASALEQTAASMEELSSTVKQNADNARQANQLAQNAANVATQGGAVVGQVVETMKGINESSRKIADIISVIDGIAFQTNILALNAAVEAARAGEQGRGFAVVASEVRGLAGRSAEAAKEIKTLITASVERVAQGTALVDQAGTTMTEVVNSIRRVTDIMGEISAASSEQSAGVAQIGEAIVQMDQATQQNAALVEEMAAAASSLKSQADDLVGTVAAFKLSAGPGRAASAPRPPARGSAHPASPSTRTPAAAPRRSALRSVPSALAAPSATKTAVPTDDGDGWASF